jgi:ribosomal protein L13
LKQELINKIRICHNPTNNTKQNKTTWLVWYYNRQKTHHHHHTTPDVITFEATSRQTRKLIFGMQPYSNPTRRGMEDNLNIFENGRIKKKMQPKTIKIKSNIILKMEDNIHLFEK